MAGEFSGLEPVAFRYWGTPLPIWATEDGNEKLCIRICFSASNEIEKSVQAGL
jgi:isoleucyl-tRNA synthetase